MEIGVTALRAELKRWLDEVKDGEEVIITDRGIPVARLTSVDAAPILEQLDQKGLIRLPRSVSRPKARGRRRIRASLPVSDLVSEQRD